MRYILFLLTLLISLFVNSQNLSRIEFNSPIDDITSDIIEMNNYFLITITQRDTIRKNGQLHWMRRAKLTKVNKSGVIIDSLILANFIQDEEVFFTKFYKGNFYTFGNSKAISDSSQLFVCKVDTSLNLVSKQFYPQLKSENFNLNLTTYLSDSILTFWGSFSGPNPLYYYFYKPFLCQFSLETMQITELVNFVDTFNITDVIIDNGISRMKIFATNFNSVFSRYSQILTYDSLNNLKRNDTVSFSTYSIINNDTFSFKSYPSDGMQYLKQQSNKHLLYTRGDKKYVTSTNYMGIYLIETDSNFNVIDYKFYDMRDSADSFIAFERGIARSNDGFIYVSCFDFFNNRGLYLLKLDSNLNTIWERHIEGYSNDRLVWIKSTSDGGVLLFDLYIADPQYFYNFNSVIIKISSSGEILFITPLENSNSIKPNLFPNPASDQLKISLSDENEILESIQIHDLQGRLVLTQKAKSHSIKLNISHLNSGPYLLRGYTKTGKCFSMKVVKE